jgi:DegV family protein with EDD domain
VTIRIVTDSNCDLPQGTLDEYGITVLPLYINVGTDSYLDGVDISRAEFYERLPKFRHHPTTSAPGPGQFYDLYQRLVEEGASEILSIHISPSLSAVINSARLAQEEFKLAPVTVFDSGQLTLGTGLQAVAAARAAAAGQTMDEIVAMLEDLRQRTYCFAGLDTLEFLRRSGRLSRFQWGLGSVLQVKPLLKMHDGVADMERVRTHARAVARVIELVEELGPLEELAVVHTHAPAEADALRRQARGLFPEGRESLSAEVTPVIGSHIGPGAVGFVAVRARQQPPDKEG